MIPFVMPFSDTPTILPTEAPGGVASVSVGAIVGIAVGGMIVVVAATALFGVCI